MSKIQLSPRQGYFNTAPEKPAGTSFKEWFGTHYAEPLQDLRGSVAFDNGDLKALLAQDCKELIFAKMQHEGRTTLIVAGVDNANNLQVGAADQNIFVGNDFNRPRYNDAISISNFEPYTISPQPSEEDNRTFEWALPSTRSGDFTYIIKDVLQNYEKYPRLNYMLTVKIPAVTIDALVNLKDSVKIAFFPIIAKVYVTEIKDNGGIEITEKYEMEVETLTAFAVDENNEVLLPQLNLARFSVAIWPPAYPPTNS